MSWMDSDDEIGHADVHAPMPDEPHQLEERFRASGEVIAAISEQAHFHDLLSRSAEVV
jgi:hypothetical protein